MRCPACQRNNDADANFCADCGAALAATCRTCGQANPIDARFCTSCGSGLPVRGPRAIPVADQALRSSAALKTQAAREGERKYLTVLIADIAGSATLIDQLDAEKAAERLDLITSAMQEAVSRFEGTVIKHQGDGIIALFGAPLPQEDHAVRACCAALAMLENVRKLAVAPVLRIGVNTGEVVVRAKLTDVSGEYDAMGKTVHIAARLEAEAAHDCVFISAATLKATAGAVDAEALGERRLRGLSETVSVFSLKGIRSAVASEQFRGNSKRSRFVGCKTEFAILRKALEDASNGNAPVVGIIGEAGSGKSRLVFEFLEACRELGHPVLEARATSYGSANALRTILDLIRTFFGIEDSPSREAAAARVREVLTQRQLTQDEPLILDLLGLPLKPRDGLPSDVTMRRQALLGAVGRIAQQISRTNVAVLVIEDLHWLDAASEPFLEVLADSLAGSATLMLVNFRPGTTGAWMTRPYFRQVTLRPLPSAMIEELLEQHLGHDRSISDLKRRIAERAAGNPFFAEELVRSLRERGVFWGGSEDLQTGAIPYDAPLPSTVESLLGSRIDRLTESDKLLLQAASVVGREFVLPVVANVAETPLAEARASMQRLLHLEMVQERLDIQRDEFAFVHPLIQEAAYRSLLTERRQRLHRAAAAALTVQFRERTDEYSSLIAHHWDEAGDKLLAASSYVRAALWIGTRDPRQALEFWRRIRILLREHESSPQADYMLMLACGQIVNYAWREGADAHEIEPIFLQAMGLADKLQDTRAASLITVAFGRVLVTTGSAADYVTKVEEAQRLLGHSGSSSVQAVLRAVHSHALTTAGDFARALEANTLALTCVEQIDSQDRQVLGFHPQVWLKTQRARILMHLDRPLETDSLLDELLNGPPIDILHQAIAMGLRIENHRHGRPGDVMAVADALQSLLKDNETPYLKVIGGRYRALALLVSGAPQLAVDLLVETLGYARRHRAGLEIEPYLLTALAEALVATRAESAVLVANEAKDLAQRRAMRTAQAEAERILRLCAELKLSAEGSY
jgi:class 3 adenylate cyclase